ncbi:MULTISPECIES: histidine phosphatase family protein [Rhodococcus]|uniref:Histidine phosphatase family protein n=1 Tax=Rhodococcus oxybenzonivorans TaxID=1990687 RepID=A0AAE4UXK0_9NOCA|nr:MULTISPECIES: histidine phosphatase family protein [Rhodococcus]MDV7243035.1 histidine phosphatase family protein [Rhodococcus oxybenzonivorans]MDV7264421.1 histidine phosphatase family protein [Rhodococcus oxybenzonivorans]MDV7275439.1 histidine phosphatase family protein [Rhodococcus oxybenzonivorans]MDV7334706.1 histidine phosphatase family protein [Rhodococcus oxybenzonivorans]MDV7344860.1 histidine phosphatase family protein [Rhodococcus oxybenzonivorans]
MSGKLILVRHGQTEANVERRLDTRLPGAPLTTEGQAQADALGARLAARASLAALVNSEALRARQTAGAVERATGLSAQTREGLYEAQAGELEDRRDDESHALFMKTFHLWHAGELGARVPGGESAHDILDRYVPVVDALRAEYLDDPDRSGDVVLVSHGAAIRLVAAQLADVPGLFAANNHLANTESVELVPTPGGGWECVRWGTIEPPFEHRVIPGADDPMG